MLITLLCVITASAIGVLFGYTYRKKREVQKYKGALSESERLISEAAKKAEQLKRDLLLEGKDEILRLRQEIEKEIKERRSEVQRSERRLEQKEDNLDKKIENITRKEEELRSDDEKIQEKLRALSTQEEEFISKLEQIAQLKREEATDMLLAKVESEANHLIGLRLIELEEKAKREADRKAQEIIATAVQRCSVEFTSDAVVSVVNLPTDDMKGRIIGREGRNIRTFETLTGVDLIVDDTPEAVTLSSFDPVRREVARMSLERLVVDGRIHPARIEEIIERA